MDNYYESQFAKLDFSIAEYKMSIVIRDAVGNKTHHLGVTPEQVKKIQAILKETENNKQ